MYIVNFGICRAAEGGGGDIDRGTRNIERLVVSIFHILMLYENTINKSSKKNNMDAQVYSE